jgi:hypothetical protein
MPASKRVMPTASDKRCSIASSNTRSGW